MDDEEPGLVSRSSIGCKEGSTEALWPASKYDSPMVGTLHGCKRTRTLEIEAEALGWPPGMCRTIYPQVHVIAVHHPLGQTAQVIPPVIGDWDPL